MEQEKITYYAAVLSLFDRNGRIEEEAMREYLSFLIDKEVKGFFPCGTSGEYVSLTLEEDMRLLRILLEENRNRKTVIPCASGADLYATLEIIKGMEDMGIREVAVCPPYYVPYRQEDILDYYRQILKQTKCSLYLYNIPNFTSPIHFQTFEQLLKEDRILGIKDSSGNMKTISRYLAVREERKKEFRVMVGTDEILLAALSAGCNGSVTALSGIIPEVHNKLFLLYKEDIVKARELQNQITKLAMLCEGFLFPVGYKIALEARGIKSKAYRQNIVEKNNPVRYETAKAEIARQVNSILAMVE